jgi:hypothetical protein
VTINRIRKCVFARLCGALALAASVAASALEPYQKEALDTILANFEPEARPVVRAQFEPMLAGMNPAQVKMLMEGMAEAELGATAVEGEMPDEEMSPAEASPEDLAWNRAQYEPVIRSLWAAQKAFDDFVVAGIAAGCGAQGSYAVWGHAWRYELWPLDPYWPRASDSPELDVGIIGGSYAARDGRYRYDFSQVRTSFDRQTVGAAVESACAQYAALGQKFVADARVRIVNDTLPGGSELEEAANSQAGVIRKRLEDVLQAEAPAANGALYQALLNGERIDSRGG